MSNNNIECEDEALKFLQEYLELAASKKEFTDIQIQVRDRLFDCHKFILSARSQVFRNMFQAENNNKIIFKDVHPDVFEEMLTFIY